MILHVDEISHHDRYRLVIGSIVPRPIAWVSTMDAAGRLNLAPFSYFNAVCPSPMTLVFCPGVHADGRKKDSWRNIEAVPEFVVNLVSHDLAAQMNQTAALLPYGESEFEKFGIAAAPSTTIRPPRVAAAPVAFECVLDRIINIGEGPLAANVVFGRIRTAHLRDDILGPDGKPDPAKLDLIARMGGDNYATTRDVFSLTRPR